MPSYFIDTSAIVKRYHRENGTDFVNKLFDEDDSKFLISRVGLIEVLSALALKVRTGQLDAENHTHAKNRFLGDVKADRINVIRVLAAHWRCAELLNNRYALSRPLRTLDAIQLAVGFELFKAGRVIHLFSADVALLAIAAEEGLEAINPVDR